MFATRVLVVNWSRGVDTGEGRKWKVERRKYGIKII